MIGVYDIMDTYHQKTGVVSTIMRVYSILSVCVITFLFANGFVTFDTIRTSYKIFAAFLACDVLQYVLVGILANIQYKSMIKKGVETTDDFYPCVKPISWTMFTLKLIIGMVLAAQVFFII